nr:Ger(x)C family spore germination C-terminal domain-containing protein [uncultured Bacillus sp.]
MAGIIEESNAHVSAEDLTQFSETASKVVENWIKEFLSKLKENHADPLGFGLRNKATRIHNYDTFTEWKEDIFPKLTFDVNVKDGIKSTGVIE